MGVITWKETVKKARQFKNTVEKEYKLADSIKWSYYFGKAILNPNKDLKKISFDKPVQSTGNNLSRQIKKADWIDITKRFVKYVETNKQMPNNIKVGKKYMRARDYTYMFARILVFYVDNGVAPKYVNVNSKAFIRPTETGNVVYDYFVKKSGKKYKYLDDFLDFVKINYTYEFYFDDKKSNKEVIDSKAGNCTDLLQMCCNMAKAMGYEFKVIHTQCRQSGTGHVYGKFRHKQNTDNEWITRDIACIVDERRSCVWCDINNGGGYLLATDPSWFYANLNR